MVKIDKTDLICAGLTVIAGAASLANFFLSGAKEDMKIKNAVNEALDERLKERESE